VRLLDRLEAMGLVERRPDPRDRRQRNLFLTQKALPELARIKALGAEVREEALAGLNTAERERLLTMLTTVKTNLQTSLAVIDEDEGDRSHG
jgi:MarR family transcriptional regulator for hemolysin